MRLWESEVRPPPNPPHAGQKMKLALQEFGPGDRISVSCLSRVGMCTCPPRRPPMQCRRRSMRPTASATGRLAPSRRSALPSKRMLHASPGPRVTWQTQVRLRNAALPPSGPHSNGSPPSPGCSGSDAQVLGAASPWGWALEIDTEADSPASRDRDQAQTVQDTPTRQSNAPQSENLQDRMQDPKVEKGHPAGIASGGDHRRRKAELPGQGGEQRPDASRQWRVGAQRC